MPETATRPPQDTGTTCPTCGAPAQSGQLICLECGSRIALGYKRPPSWRLPAVIVAVIVLATAVGIYAAIGALTDDAEKEVASQPTPSQPAGSGSDDTGSGEDDGNAGGDRTGGDAAAGKEKPAEEKPAKKKPAKKKPAEESPDDGASAPAVGTGGVRRWPEGEDGFTVVILSSENRASARAFAQNAIKAGTKAGVLRADDYPALSASTGFFIVFVGTYPNQAGADRAAARLGRRYQGAYPQFVDGSKAKR